MNAIKNLSEDSIDEMVNALPLVKILFSTNHTRPLKGLEIVSMINSHRVKSGMNASFTDFKLRKLVNHIRKESVMPVIATSKGYYVSFDKDEIATQIESLAHRANCILEAKDGLTKFL